MLFRKTRKVLIEHCRQTPLLLCLVLLAPSADAALEGRLPKTPCGDDYQAYYDTELDITWATNVAETGFNTWHEHAAWAESLSINNVSGWRLPDVDVDDDGVVVRCQWDATVPCADNEMHYHLFRNGVTPATPAPFTDFDQSGIYFLNTESWVSSGRVWGISISIFRGVGGMGDYSESALGLAWPVRNGDVPEMSPGDLVVNLVDKIVALNLQRGLSTSLDSKLNAARQAIELLKVEDHNSAVNMLYAFNYAVEAQRDVHISGEQADELISGATYIIDSLACY